MPEFTRDQFLAQRAAERGSRSPERMNSPVWEWIAREHLGAWVAGDRILGPEWAALELSEPGWSFDRYGRSITELPDGRVVWVAGEHEDYGDPDFFIYNDVVVEHPGGRLEILGYPETDFPPTDFHTATHDAARNCIWLVGNLGYPDDRRSGETQVLRLALDSFEVAAVACSGDAPGWIHNHGTELVGDALEVRRGIRAQTGVGFLDQVDDWTLDLETLEWSRATHREYQQWSVRRVDGGHLALTEMSLAQFSERSAEQDEAMARATGARLLASGEDPVTVEQFVARILETGALVRENFDAETFDSLYVPPLPHVEFRYDESDETRNMRNDEARIEVDGAIVRYADERDAVALKIEGPLAPDRAARLCNDLAAKLGRLHGAACEATLTWRQR